MHGESGDRCAASGATSAADAVADDETYQEFVKELMDKQIFLGMTCSTHVPRLSHSFVQVSFQKKKRFFFKKLFIFYCKVIAHGRRAF